MPTPTPKNNTNLDITRPPSNGNGNGNGQPMVKVEKQSLSRFIAGKVANIMQGQTAERFVTNVISLCSANPALAQCDQTTLVAACLQVHTLGLSFNQSLGQAYVVPFKDTKNGRVTASMQIGYRGLIQLAIRSGQYKRINVTVIKEGELKSWNPLTEELIVEINTDDLAREKLPTIGYYASFEYLNGFTKAMYWSKARMEAHAARYSQSYRMDKRYNKASSFWSTGFDQMAMKTMLRQLISKWGIMSVDLEKAIILDNKANIADMPPAETIEINDYDAPASAEDAMPEDAPEDGKADAPAVDAPVSAQDEK